MTIATFRALTLALLATGCLATAEIKETRDSPTASLSPGEAITVVSLLSGDEQEHADCVAEGIRELAAGIRFVAPAEFSDGMYPWFEPSTAPTTTEGLARMMEQAVVRQKIVSFGVRYVVAIGGQHGTKLGSWGVGIPAHGMVVAVLNWNWTRSTRLTATILDLKQARPVSNVSAVASGTGGAGLLVIIPYFVPGPDTAATTCQAIAQRVVGFLKGEPQPPD